MPSQALPEHWTELEAARSQLRLCEADVEKLKTACVRDCGRPHVAQCKVCYGKVLDRMRQRYSESGEREWFSQRRAFLQELDDMFSDASNNRSHNNKGKGSSSSLETIEDHIASEKEAWYRWVLRRNPDFLEVAEHNVPLEEMRGMLDDPDRSREELVAMMWQGVGGLPEDWSEKVDRLAKRASALKRQPQELKKLYVEEFFLQQRADEGAGAVVVVEHAQPFLDGYQASSDGPTLELEHMVGRIVEAKKRNKSSQHQRDAHVSRLDELRRARTAFEQKRKESKALLLQSAQAVRPELYRLPPCAVCRGAVSTQDVFSCALCQALVHMSGGDGDGDGDGGDGDGDHVQLTVYCSEDCYARGQDRHVAEAHDCEAGEQCVQLADEDVDMSDGPAEAVLCRSCMEEKRRATVYCSHRCASERLGIHVKEAHGSGAAAAAVLVAEIVDSTLEKQNPSIKFERL